MIILLLNPPVCSECTHQQTPESEATLLVGDGVLTVDATLSLSHRLHGHVPLCVPTQRLHCSVAAGEDSNETVITDKTQVEPDCKTYLTCFLKYL